MSDETINLSRDEFYLLHFLIEKECDRLLILEGKKGLNRDTEQCYYGFQNGAPNLDDPEDEYQNSSIKYVVLAQLDNEIKHNRKKYHLSLDRYENIQFNARYLYELKNEFNANSQKIAIRKNYLLVFLKLLKVDSIEKLKKKYEEDNGETHHAIFEDWIKPAKSSKGPKDTADEEEANFLETILQKKLTFQSEHQYSKEEIFEFKLRLLEGTNWYFYRIDYMNKGQEQSIKRMVLRIGKMLANGDLEVELVAKSSTFSDYSGRISRSDSNDKILICRLSTKDIGAKLKVLMFHIDPRIKSKIYLGQYLEYDDNYAIMGGTVIIHKISPDQKIDLESKRFIYNTDYINQEVPAAIRAYFEGKFLNFTKTPTGISTFYDLNNWLERKRIEREKLNPPRINDLYISIPFVELQHDIPKLQELEEILYKMLSDPVLEVIGIDKNKTHHRNVEKNQLSEADYLLKRDQENIKKSKAFLFIFPQEKKILTSVFLQTGYAIHGGFPTFVMYKDFNCLPYSLQISKALNHVKMRKIESLSDILKFPEWVKVNEYYKLYGHAM